MLVCAINTADFEARLVWYAERSPDVPTGAIGDPSKDWVSGGFMGDGHCGTFQAGEPLAVERDTVSRSLHPCQHVNEKCMVGRVG